MLERFILFPVDGREFYVKDSHLARSCKNQILKPILIFVCLIIIVISPLLEAKEKRGTDVLIRKISTIEILGELIAVKADALLVLDSKTGADVTIGIDEICDIKIIIKSHPWRGAGIGLLTGVVYGWVYGYAFPGDAETDDFYPKAYAIMFSGPGALAGFLISLISAVDKTYLIQGQDQRFVKAAMEELRKKARVKDFN